MVTIDQVVAEHYPDLNVRRMSGPTIKSRLRRLLHEQTFLDFAKEYPHLHGIEFIEQVFDYFHFSYAVTDCQWENIPSCGKVIIIANHPYLGIRSNGLSTLIDKMQGQKIYAHIVL